MNGSLFNGLIKLDLIDLARNYKITSNMCCKTCLIKEYTRNLHMNLQLEWQLYLSIWLLLIFRNTTVNKVEHVYKYTCFYIFKTIVFVIHV